MCVCFSFSCVNFSCVCVCTVCVYIHQDMEFGEWSVCTGADWTLSESYNHWTLLDL